LKSKDLIVVLTTPGRENWVKEVLSSITRPCVVVSDFGFELGKLNWVLENTTADRFLILQDSVVIRDEKFFDLIFAVDGSACFIEGDHCYNGFMGLYERTVLSDLIIPRVSDKSQSVKYEVEWTQEYIAACGQVDHPIPISQKKFETVRKFGRENLVLLTPYFEKWYGTWAIESKEEEESRVSLLSQTELEKSRLIMRLIRENQSLRKTFLNRLTEAFRAMRADRPSR
jgi:hypothetical protein